MVRRISIVMVMALAMVAAAPATGGNVPVTQMDKKFSVRIVEIKVGDTVTFVNADRAHHNLYSETTGFEFDLGNQSPGEWTTVPFTRPGIVEVRCAIHPKMKLVVRIVP